MTEIDERLAEVRERAERGQWHCAVEDMRYLVDLVDHLHEQLATVMEELVPDVDLLRRATTHVYFSDDLFSSAANDEKTLAALAARIRDWHEENVDG